MAFGWASMDFPPVFHDEHNNDCLLPEHGQNESNELNSYEILIKLLLMILYWVSGGHDKNVILIRGSAQERIIKNDEIASTSDSCNIEKSVMSLKLHLEVLWGKKLRQSSLLLVQQFLLSNHLITLCLWSFLELKIHTCWDLSRKVL